jgi:hypothetical protein
MPSTPEVLRVKECAPTFFSRCFILGPPLGLLSSLGACHPFCLNFIMFWSKVGIWFTIQLLFLTFHLSSPIFCTTFHMRFGLPHPSIAGILRHVCTHNSDPMGIHLLCCVHDNERIGTHDVIDDTFVTIAWDVSFHVGRKWLYALPSITFNSFRWWLNIVLTKDDICTLTNIVIVDPTWVDLLFRSCTTQRFVALDAPQAKEKSYYNWHPTDQFFPLTIEVFGCLHKHVDVFLNECANAIWSLKGIKGSHLSTLVTFLHQKISRTL